MKLRWSDVTPEALYLNRRAFAGGAVALAASTMLAAPALAEERPATLEQISNYNNFIEFGFDKRDPARLAGGLTLTPWEIRIDGLVERPGSYTLDDIAPANAVEERIYRLRCVEAWAMVVPWNGVPLAAVLAKAGVRPGAKFVAFETVERPSEMPMQRRESLGWPYREGLRLDEALHPLTILATGIYGKPMPPQNGAPIRLVVPWKYGFKSIKSVVRITLTDRQPRTLWNDLQPDEYGFYANVNPKVDHPRWSQATERGVGAGMFARRKPTLMFNGYTEQVAALYAGMDLVTNY